MKRMKAIASAGIMALSAALWIVAGCTKPEAEAGGNGGASTGASVGTADVAKGKAVFDANGCGNCHGGGKAPDLSKAGAAHDAAWLIAHIKNPKTHNPGSRMPGYEGKISEADMTALGGYLASLK
jgi:mono/diheme cytochrome c family protein